MKSEAGDPGVVAVASPELASQVGSAGLSSCGNDGFQIEIDEADRGVARTRGIDEFGPIAGSHGLGPTVELGRDEDEAAPRGQSVAQHEIREDVLAAQLLETGAREDGAGGVAVETAGLRSLEVAGPRRGSRACETLDELQLDGDDGSFTVGGGSLDEGVKGSAVAEVGVVERPGLCSKRRAVTSWMKPGRRRRQTREARSRSLASGARRLRVSACEDRRLAQSLSSFQSAPGSRKSRACRAWSRIAGVRKVAPICAASR